MPTRARAVLFCLALIVLAVLCSTRVASEAGLRRGEVVASVAENTGRPRDPLRSDAGLKPEPPRLEPLPFDAGGPPPPYDAGAPLPLEPLASSVRER